MPIDERTEAWATLALKALPHRAIFALLQHFSDPIAVLRATRAQLAKVVPAAVVERIVAPIAPERLAASIKWLDAPDHRLIAWDDPSYPRALLDIADPPLVLFHSGRHDLLNKTSIAIVGSRNATPQGIENARELANALSKAGVTIVSGLAAGIDAAAHRGALEGEGSTVAVVGTGPDRVYPARNRELARTICERGTMISEYAPGTPALKENFPRRNRLLSGMCRGVVVVEATLSSGSLITARLAGEQGKDVFAIPGSIHSPFSKGPHELIRQGAKLVETAQHVLDELGLKIAVSALSDSGKPPREPTHARLLDAIAYDPVDVDTLIVRTHMPPNELQAALTALELDGRIASLPGGRWQRVGRAAFHTRA